ncbi:RelA/SpoT domain-containing protein [Klebsiella variicola]|uniref:RelA/SpoT domain-containing protein n=1 Tax=Klebsiella variicola TaxID=244366 RepID=UPI0012B98D0E|nr:RelA/SpoT domain-containing protein [Klebsiella variicola]
MYELGCSRKEVSRAGERLVGCFRHKQTYDDKDVQILHDWRMCHMYPLEQLTKYLEREAKAVNSNAIISSRIKRLPSIVEKLARFPSMQLGRMQDLGGCRAIVDNIEQVYAIKEKILSLTFKHKLHKVHDYISVTKESGYRSLHIIHSFQNQKYTDLNGLKIEMQVRTAIQHSWATAVEMVGIFRRESLKSSLGDARWLRFFILVSELFYRIESKDPTLNKSHNVISLELKLLSQELNVHSVLNAFSQIAEHITKSKLYDSGYCVIVVNTNKKHISVTSFSNQMIKRASEFYMKEEKKCAENKHQVAAMVSVNSINDLKAAYPAFFLDTKTFLNNLSRFTI